MLSTQLLPSHEEDVHTFDLEKNAPPAPQESIEEKPNIRCKRARILLWSAPLITTIAETSEVGYEVNTVGNQKILEMISINTFSKSIIISSYFLQALAVNGPATIKGIDETCDAIKTRKRPPQWPELSTCQEYTALTLASACSGYAAFADCISSSYFMTELGYNPILAYTVGAASALTNIFCEGIRVYQITREIIVRKPRTYQNSVSRYLTPLLGYPLAFMNGMQDAIWSYAPIAAKFNLTTNSEKWGFFIASLTNGLSDACFSGGMNIDTLDDVFGELFNGHCPQFSKLFAATLSILWASIPADLLRRQTLIFLLSPETALPFTLSPLIIETLVWCGAVSSGINFAKNTYQHFLMLTHGVQNSCQRLYEYCFSERENRPPDLPPSTPVMYVTIEPEPNPDPRKEAKESKVSQPSKTPESAPQLNRYQFFQQPAVTPTIDSPTPRVSTCTRIMRFFRF